MPPEIKITLVIILGPIVIVCLIFFTLWFWEQADKYYRKQVSEKVTATANAILKKVFNLK